MALQEQQPEAKVVDRAAAKLAWREGYKAGMLFRKLELDTMLSDLYELRCALIGRRVAYSQSATGELASCSPACKQCPPDRRCPAAKDGTAALDYDRKLRLELVYMDIRGWSADNQWPKAWATLGAGQRELAFKAPLTYVQEPRKEWTDGSE